MLYDCSNSIMIYLLALAVSIGASAVLMKEFSWTFAIASAVILAGFVFMRLFIGQFVVSIVAHILVIVVCWYAFGAIGDDPFNKVIISLFALLMSVLDISDFYKKKNQGYGEIHILSCALFIPVYAYVAWKAASLEKSSDALEQVIGYRDDIFGTVICVLCIVFFGLALVRAYMKNAIKLVDNSQIDENAPVTYMYGNSNKFIGPIIAFIIVVMLVVQSRTSANIFGNMWMGLLGGVAYIMNLFSFTRSDATTFIDGTQIAQPGSKMYAAEVVVAVIILAAIVIAIAVIISKIYKSHWHKDVNSDETLESAAMVEKREWIYHKESRKSEDTSVTKAAEIPTNFDNTDTFVEEPSFEEVQEPVVEEVQEPEVEEVKEPEVEEVKEPEVEEVKEPEVEEVKEPEVEEVKEPVVTEVQEPEVKEENKDTVKDTAKKSTKHNDDRKKSNKSKKN